MANVLFAGQALGLIVLPLMIFHQMQLMACAALARHYARTSLPAFDPGAVTSSHAARHQTFTVEAR
jgi:sodium/bile acid cotransporter 7